MSRVASRLFIHAVAATAAAAVPSYAATARAQATPLAAGDFTLTLSRIDASSGAFVPLDTSGLAGYFSAARCACPTSVAVDLVLGSDGAAKLQTGDSLDATVMVGSDCDNAAAAACQTVGSVLTLDASTTESSETLSTAAVFSAAGAGGSCGALSASSTRLWAIVRQNGTRIASHPSLAIGIGGAGPQAPTAVKLTTADSGLLVSWTGVADGTTIQGYQILCAPGPSPAPAAAYELCPAAAAAAPDGGTGPFATLDAKLVCSDLVSASVTTARVHGLANGTAYQVAVIAIGNDGTPSTPSDAAQETPGPTLGFDDLYKEAGGTGQAGCAVADGVAEPGNGAGGGARPAFVPVGIALAILVATLALRRRGPRRRWRRRRRGQGRAAPGMLLALSFWIATLAAARARADEYGFNPWTDATPSPASTPSPRQWNLQLGFGPYLPAVDGEFADRGQAARPFEQVFSSSKRLMTTLEIDRQLLHWNGSWSLGVGAGYYRVSASSLAADHLTRTGDTTALRLIPLSLSVVYRADQLHESSGFPLVPYARAGVDCGLWSISDTAKTASMSGSTFGWHAAAGVTLDLSFLDPEAARTMDQEMGVNQFALFFEVAHTALDGFGSGSVLHLGDTAWLAGLMLEL
jgi:hypothetical protein